MTPYRCTAGTVVVVPRPLPRLPAVPPFGDLMCVLSTFACVRGRCRYGGTDFDRPATVTFPNVTGLAPGEEVEILALGTIHTGEPYAGNVGAVGTGHTGHVSDDGERIESDVGEGPRVLSWLGYRHVSR